MTCASGSSPFKDEKLEQLQTFEFSICRTRATWRENSAIFVTSFWLQESIAQMYEVFIVAVVQAGNTFPTCSRVKVFIWSTLLINTTNMAERDQLPFEN